MKNGYKKISKHGSINLPVAMRREIGLQGGDPMEVSMKNGVIMVRPYTPRCIFCGTTEHIRQLEGKGLCPACAAKVSQIMEGENGWNNQS